MTAQVGLDLGTQKTSKNIIWINYAGVDELL